MVSKEAMEDLSRFIIRVSELDCEPESTIAALAIHVKQLQLEIIAMERRCEARHSHADPMQALLERCYANAR